MGLFCSCEMEQEKQEAENDETTDQSKEINAESNLVLTPPPVLAPTPPPVDKVSTVSIIKKFNLLFFYPNEGLDD